MPSHRRAVIDVGTNSIKLLVADVDGRVVRPVWEGGRQTRLGEGFYDTRQLRPRNIANTARAVADFADRARAEHAATIRVIGTSAARDALNAPELSEAIKHAAGLDFQIISGEQEADWAFLGVTTDPALADQPLLLLDVGGGSTEFILGQGSAKQFAQSFPLGTVRLLEQMRPSDPPKPKELAACRRAVTEFLRNEVQARLEPLLRDDSAPARDRPARQLVGTGGTASVLGCMEAELETFDRDRLEATRLSLERLRGQVGRLWGMPLADRKRLVGLPPERADVILTGSVIYEAIAGQFGFSQLRLSTRGLRFAALMED